MANFELTIDKEGFKSLGVNAHFDEKLYNELLQEFTVAPSQPSIILKPHMSWGLNATARTFKRLRHPLRFSDYGEYRGGGELNILCTEDIEDTNDTLLHETKHYIDDETGDAHHHSFVRKNCLYGIAGAFITTEIATELTIPPDFKMVSSAVLAVSGIALIKHYSYSVAPEELSARKFAEDTDILEAYGQIISYSNTI
jgi:hypothetical protein